MTKVGPSLIIPSPEAVACSIVRRLCAGSVTCFGHPVHACMFILYQLFYFPFPDSITLGWLSQTTCFQKVITIIRNQWNSL